MCTVRAGCRVRDWSPLLQTVCVFKCTSIITGMYKIEHKIASINKLHGTRVQSGKTVMIARGLACRCKIAQCVFPMHCSNPE